MSLNVAARRPRGRRVVRHRRRHDRRSPRQALAQALFLATLIAFALVFTAADQVGDPFPAVLYGP